MSRKHRLKLKYNMTEEEFEALLKEQDNKCACCGKDSPGHTNWCIDHDHDTGVVRGILCKMCNSGISWLGDTLEGVTNAINYLRMSNAVQNEDKCKPIHKPII